MKLHFPHISRIFSAQVFSWIGNLCLWILLLILVSFNAFLRLTTPLAYSDKLIDIFTHPFSAPAHENLAQILLDSGQRSLANHERAIVAELSPVLGANSTEKAARDEANKVYWQNILASHPGYRDAYIQLAVLLYREGNLVQTRAYLVKAQLLDPNNATVNHLVDFISKLSG